jgi:hypothetical protein
MNGQMRWDLYHAQKSEGDEVRRIRHPVLCQSKNPPLRRRRKQKGQKVGQTYFMRKPLSMGLGSPARPSLRWRMAPEDRSHAKDVAE